MNRPWIRVGDKTSKGGIVFTGSSCVRFGGKSAARVGDRATCHCNQCKHRGYTVISSGSGTFKADGLAVARDGDSTDCGAVLMSTEGAAYSEAVKVASTLGDRARPFDIRFQLKSEKTGKPMPNVPYRLTLADGKEVRGKTDANGLTSVIGADLEATANLDAPYYGDSTSTTDAQSGHDACRC